MRAHTYTNTHLTFSTSIRADSPVCRLVSFHCGVNRTHNNDDNNNNTNKVLSPPVSIILLLALVLDPLLFSLSLPLFPLFSSFNSSSSSFFHFLHSHSTPSHIVPSIKRYSSHSFSLPVHSSISFITLHPSSFITTPLLL